MSSWKCGKKQIMFCTTHKKFWRFLRRCAISQQLRDAGHQVHYIAIDDTDNLQSVPANIDALISQYQATVFEYQAPDEWRLDQQLYQHGRRANIPWVMVDSDHFYTNRNEVSDIFTGRKQWLMEFFYRQMRVTHHVLMEDTKKPLGGQWNYDHDNRKPWRGNPPEPQDTRTLHDHSDLWQTIVDAGVKVSAILRPGNWHGHLTVRKRYNNWMLSSIMRCRSLAIFKTR
jgi:deoxyribodipyrimidine photolyase-related protein